MPLAEAQRLRTLALVLDLGSISAAAGVLGYTQSAVSQQLAALERSIGEPLVDRTQRPLRATEAGEVLLPHVKRVLAELTGAGEALDDLRRGSRRVRLAAFPSALSSFVPAAVRDLRREHPDAAVHVLQLETEEAVTALRDGAADLATVHYLPGISVPQTTGLVSQQLLTDRLYAIVPVGHRLARRGSVSVGELEGEALGLPRRDTPAGRFRTLVEQLCAEHGFAPRIAYEIDDLPAAKAFVAAGVCVGLMHGLTLIDRPAGVAVVPLTERDAGARRIEVLARSGPDTPLAGELLAHLARAARAHRSHAGERAG